MRLLMKGLSFFFILFPCFIAFGADDKSGLPKDLIDVRYKLCPFTQQPAKEEIAAIFNGRVYHFCCPKCIETFNKDPKQSISKIQNAKEVPLKVTNVDEKCPVLGEKADVNIFIVRDDNITFYCCAGCIGKDKLSDNTDNASATKIEEPKKTQEIKSSEKSE